MPGFALAPPMFPSTVIHACSEAPRRIHMACWLPDPLMLKTNGVAVVKFRASRNMATAFPAGLTTSVDVIVSPADARRSAHPRPFG